MKFHPLSLVAASRHDTPCRGAVEKVLAVLSSVLVISSGILYLTSCGPDKKAPDAVASPTSAGTTAPEIKVSDAKPSAAPVVVPVKKEIPDVPPKGPATPAEAALMLDLNKVPLMDGVDKDSAQRTIANLVYKATSTVKAAFEFHQKQLLGQRWKEMPNSYVNEQSASGIFARNTFHVSVSVMPDSTPGMVMIMIHNHGNVNLSRLPRPPTQKTVYEGEIAAMYVTDAPVEATAEACRKLLVADGWEPYGSAGDSANFKQNGIIVSARASAAPAEGGKTMISFAKEMMSADLPAPPDAEDVRYIDGYRRLTFETAAPKEAIADYYKTKLAKTGWKPNKDELLSVDDKFIMVFREPSGGLMFLDIMREYQGKRKVQVAGTTMAEFDEESKKAKEKAVAYVKKKEEQEKKAAADKPTVSVTLPPGAKDVKFAKERLEFTLGSGKAKAIAEGWRKQYRDAGWKEDVANLSTAFGALALSKEGQNLSINYVDTGVMPAEFSIYTIGVDLVRVGGE